MWSFKNSWKNYLLSKPDLDISNNHSEKIKELSNPKNLFETAFEEISKNLGISFIYLDPTELFIQLLHHCHVIGGSWSNPTKVFLSVLGTDNSAKPIQIILKSVKIVKTKTASLSEMIGDDQVVKIIGGKGKQSKQEFYYRNIIPNPHFLTKAYLVLESFDPQSVAMPFLMAMKEFDENENTKSTQEVVTSPGTNKDDDQDVSKFQEDSDGNSTNSNKDDKSSKLLLEFAHVIQFC